MSNSVKIRMVQFTEDEFRDLLHGHLQALKQQIIQEAEFKVEQHELVGLMELSKRINRSPTYIYRAIEEGVIKPGYLITKDSKHELFDPKEVIQQIKDFNHNQLQRI